MIIDGQAVLLYGVPSLTNDIDITLRASIDELVRAIKALEDIGLEVLPEDIEDFVKRTGVLKWLKEFDSAIETGGFTALFADPCRRSE